MKPESSAKLLVVDDEPLNIRVMHEIFGEQFQVLMATGGLQAIELSRAQSPDLILLDVSMPDLDGYEVCRRLKQDPATEHIPVIFVTGANTPEEETKGLACGGVDFISKPVNPAVVMARVRTQLTLKRQSDLLRNMAYLDGVTGIANRRKFDEQLGREAQICHRSGEGIAIAMVDVDDFKSFNDHYGHAAGDDCLRRVATALQACMRRPRDLVARYGGEEFVCLMPGIEPASAGEMAEVLRATVADQSIPHALSSCAPHVTVSIGWSFGRPVVGADPDNLIKEADEALYLAKERGRNRVFGTSPE